MKKTTLLVLAAGILIGGFLYKRYRVAPDIPPTGITFTTPDGVKDLSDYQGENLLVVFYAKWCGECMGEMRPLEAAKPILSPSNFRILALTDDTPEEIKLVRDHFGITFDTFKLENTLKDHGVYTIPTAYVLNERGEIVFEHVGVLDFEDQKLLDEIKALVKG
ncbi:MAG: TlpA family protein disulfide reductase [Flavobacteriales bacterium]|nr:TlpA family protein disulfide reductase [Flavobacteriales bacterium]